jgi:uncharacterized linocin/CFP29 family protein
MTANELDETWLAEGIAMTQDNSQVPWTEEQWARANQVIQEEASRARVGAQFLPLLGPLSASEDFVRNELISYPDVTQGGSQKRISIADTDTIKLPTLQVKVYLRGAQMADPEMTSALAILRRAANALARLEDAIIFNGQSTPGGDAKANPKSGVEKLPKIWEILGGQDNDGLLGAAATRREVSIGLDEEESGQHLVAAVSEAIGDLEASGHFGPFAVVLDQKLFLVAQTPDKGSLVLPQDRIIPFQGGGPLLRSGTLPEDKGVVVALGGAPVELVVATDVTLQFLQVTADPSFVFRVMEKMVLRIKESDAIVRLVGSRSQAQAQDQSSRPPHQSPKDKQK